MEDVGISFEWTDNDVTSSYGIRINLHELELGLQYATEVQIDEYTIQGGYTNFSINGLAVALLYWYIQTDQTYQTVVPAR